MTKTEMEHWHGIAEELNHWRACARDVGETDGHGWVLTTQDLREQGVRLTRERDEARALLVKIRAHTAWRYPSDGDVLGLLMGLLRSIERLSSALDPEGCAAPDALRAWVTAVADRPCECAPEDPPGTCLACQARALLGAGQGTP